MQMHASVFVGPCFSQGLDLLILENSVKIKLKSRRFYSLMN